MNKLPFRYSKIALVGTNGSGKSTVCQYLGERGYTVVSLSDLVREAAKEKGRGQDRDSLTQTGIELKEDHGRAVLAERAFAKYENTQQVVFDSIRNPKELEFLKNHDVYCIGVTASAKTRFSRIQARKHSTDHIDFETFQRQDKAESEGQNKAQHIQAALDLCHSHLTNDGTLEALHQQLQDNLCHA